MVLVIRAATLGLVLSLWGAGMIVWSRHRARKKRQFEHRLGLLESAGEPLRVLRLWHDGQEATTTVPENRSSTRWRDRLDYLVREAGWTVPAGPLLVLVAVAVASLAVVTYQLTGGIVPAGLAAVAVVAAFWTYTGHRIRRRAALFDRQLVSALELAARSLRAGHPVLSAFRVVAEEIEAPVGAVFAEICQQQELGIAQEDAIRSAASKCQNTDMSLLAISVAIQLRTGGNLAAMMNRLSSVIRDRLRLNRRVRVLTAQTQLSKQVLIALPFIVFFVLHVISPAYMEPLYTTAVGRALLALAGAGILLGWWLMKRIAVLAY